MYYRKRGLPPGGHTCHSGEYLGGRIPKDERRQDRITPQTDAELPHSKSNNFCD